MLSNLDRKNITVIRQFVTPSFLSGIIAFVLPLLVVINSAANRKFRNSYINPVAGRLKADSSGITTDYNHIVDHLSKNPLLNSFYLYLFWILVGILVYFLTIKVVSYFRGAVEVKKELYFMNTDRKVLLSDVLKLIVIRFIAIIVIFILASFYFNYLTKKLFSNGRLFFEFLQFNTFFHMLLYYVLAVICILIISVFVRIFFDRSRIFG